MKICDFPSLFPSVAFQASKDINGAVIVMPSLLRLLLMWYKISFSRAAIGLLCLRKRNRSNMLNLTCLGKAKVNLVVRVLVKVTFVLGIKVP